MNRENIGNFARITDITKSKSINKRIGIETHNFNEYRTDIIYRKGNPA